MRVVLQAVKTPIPIMVEKFDPSSEPWPLQVHERSSGEFQVFNRLHESWINLQPGDYVNVTDTTGQDIYPIDKATFDSTYTVVTE